MSSEEITMVINVISGILNPDNETRKTFVSKLDELRKNTPALFFCLVKILELEDQGNVSTKQAKTVAAVLARKLMVITDDELINEHWTKIEKEHKEAIKVSLLNSLINEKDTGIKLKICDLINVVAMNIFESDEKWNELISAVMQILSMGLSADICQSECALIILAGTYGYVYEEMMSHIESLLACFRTFLSSSELILRTRTCRSIAEIVTFLDKKHIKYFHEFVFPLLETTLKCLESKDIKAEGYLKYCLKSITDISGSYPVLFKKHFSDLFQLMCKIADHKDFSDENIREMGFECVVSLIERRTSLFLKDEEKLKYFLELLFKYALEMDKEVTDDWAVPTTHQYMEEEFIYEEKVSSTFSFIDRLIESLDAKFMLKYLSDFVMQLLSNDKDWRFKYVALLTVSQLINYVDDITTVENILPIIFEHTRHESPKVRYASVNCINELAETFQPAFQANYHEKAVSHLLERIHSEAVLRVQLEALESLHTFISHQDEQQCLVYIAPLLENLFGLFIKDLPLNLRNEILEVIAEIIVTVDKSFTPYAERSLKLLLEFFVNSYTSKTSRSVYGNLIECITLCGPHSMDYYTTIIPDLVKIVVELTENMPNSEDPIREYLQEAFERLIPILKKSFKDSLPHVINAVLKLAENVPQISLNSNPEDTFKLEDLFQKENNEPQIKIQSVKTSETEDKSESLKLLNTTIEALDELFLPYVSKTQEIIFPLLKYYINEDVRQAASNTLPLILNIIKKYSPADLASFGKVYISQLIEIIEKEFDNETLSIQLENLGEIILLVDLILDQNELNMLFSKIWLLFDEVEKRRLKLTNRHSQVKSATHKKNFDKMDKEEDEVDSDEELMEEIEKDIEEIENIQSDIADLIGFLFKTHKSLTSDIVNLILKEKLPFYFREDASSFEIKMGIFIADDMIEYLGQDYFNNFWNDLAHVVIKFCDNKDHTLRQAACYGVGVFAQHTLRDFHVYFDNCLAALNKALAFSPGEDDEHEWGLARDNAVAALGKIIKHQGSLKSDCISVLISQWIKLLPITYDINESPEQHELLCDIVQSKPDLALGENYINFPIILRILAKIYMTKYSNKEVNEKIQKIFAGIKSDQTLLNLTANTMQSSEEKIRKKLQNLLS
jgi:hypothetical protein